MSLPDLEKWKDMAEPNEGELEALFKAEIDVVYKNATRKREGDIFLAVSG